MSREDTIRKIHGEYLSKKINEAVDDAIVVEIEIFISHDEPLYKMSQLIIKNLKRKLAKKIFDKKLAVKAFTHVAKAAIKKYGKKLGDLGIPRGSVKKTEEAIAQLLFDKYSNELKEFNEKYIDVLNRLNEDNRYSILKSLNDPIESVKVISFIEGL